LEFRIGYEELRKFINRSWTREDRVYHEENKYVFNVRVFNSSAVNIDFLSLVGILHKIYIPVKL